MVNLISNYRQEVPTFTTTTNCCLVEVETSLRTRRLANKKNKIIAASLTALDSATLKIKGRCSKKA